MSSLEPVSPEEALALAEAEAGSFSLPRVGPVNQDLADVRERDRAREMSPTGSLASLRRPSVSSHYVAESLKSSRQLRLIKSFLPVYTPRELLNKSRVLINHGKESILIEINTIFEGEGIPEQPTLPKLKIPSPINKDHSPSQRYNKYRSLV